MRMNWGRTVRGLAGCCRNLGVSQGRVLGRGATGPDFDPCSHPCWVGETEDKGRSWEASDEDFVVIQMNFLGASSVSFNPLSGPEAGPLRLHFKDNTEAQGARFELWETDSRPGNP